MSAADKTKLDGVASGAQVNVLEGVTGTAPIVAGAVTAKSQAISISAATTSAAGSQSAADKLKLDFDILPVGIGRNYRIVPSVSSNNLTLSLKGLDGNDPSATNPITVRIGNTERTITTALSVTKNAGTGWFRAGEAELATKEIDYFVYLGYNATDGVVIGFSRLPWANSYGDFSTLAGNEKYCAISTITNAVAGDDYVNIGRFAATLSLGGAYTWSVPTFTTSNLINRPIFETRLLSYVGLVTSGLGSTAPPCIVNSSCTYKISGQILYLNNTITITNKGTAGGALFVSQPWTIASLAATGVEIGATGKIITLTENASKTQFILYDGTTVWVNTWVPAFSIFTHIS